MPRPLEKQDPPPKMLNQGPSRNQLANTRFCTMRQRSLLGELFLDKRNKVPSRFVSLA